MVSWMVSGNLKRVPGKLAYDRSQTKGFRFRDSAFQIPARTALDNIWWSCRVASALSGVFILLLAIVLHAVGDLAPFYASHFFPAHLVESISRILLFFVFTDERRGKIKAFLTSISTKDETKSAASVAALLGNINAERGLAMAKDKFRSISFQDLSEEDLLLNTDSKDESNNLYSKTLQARLGSCDVFISHSWSDDGKKKFAVLQQWAMDFKDKNGGREPQLWLDKACINQNDIASDLMCLPVFLAGCEVQKKNYNSQKYKLYTVMIIGFCLIL